KNSCSSTYAKPIGNSRSSVRELKLLVRAIISILRPISSSKDVSFVELANQLQTCAKGVQIPTLASGKYIPLLGWMTLITVQELLKYSVPDGPGFAKLEEVCNTVKQVADHVNSMKARSERIHKLLEIQSRIESVCTNIEL